MARAEARHLRLSSFMPYRLSVAAHAVLSLVTDAYQQEFGLPIPEWRVVAVLQEFGSLTQQQVVARSTLDKQTVSRAVRGLLRKRLIQRQRSSSDGRAYNLRLSAAGERLHARLTPLALELEQRLLAGLTPTQARQLIDQLVRLEQAARAAAAARAGGAVRRQD